MKSLPTSNLAIKQSVLRTQQPNLTPQESEQLSEYVSDDTYVKKQKEDIEELASMFKDLLGQAQKTDEAPYIAELQARFKSIEGFAANYLFMIDGEIKPLYLGVDGSDLTIHYGEEENIDVFAKLSSEVMRSIVDGRMTFQRAFMTGDMSAKGNFKTLRTLDQLFPLA
jgi:hypothetical protein